jgi:heat shock protein HslJ
MRWISLAGLALLAAACGAPSDRLSDEEASAGQGAAIEENGAVEESEGAAITGQLPDPADSGPILYKALGNEPGWSLTVRSARVDYMGDYGEVNIAEPTPPDFRATHGSYRSGRLQITISAGPCSDGMSDLTYRQTVRVTADSKTVDGCGGGTISPASLAGTSWSVTAINGRQTPGGANYFLNFGEGSLSAKFGCNSIGGPYRQNGDHVTAPQLQQTLIGCPEPAGSHERDATAILRSNMRLERISGERARLVSEAGSIDLRRAI